MSKIPTAEDFCNERLGFEEYGTDVSYFMIEFAKLHVEAFRQNLLTNHLESWDDCEVTTKECVENSYPLENIK